MRLPDWRPLGPARSTPDAHPGDAPLPFVRGGGLARSASAAGHRSPFREHTRPYDCVGPVSSDRRSPLSCSPKAETRPCALVV